MGLVLIVDDEADIRELVRLSLQLADHEVAQAVDGLAALSALAGGLRPDLVILDVMMPGLDGWDTVARMKADPDGAVSGIPVIMLTARAGDMDRVRGGIEGALAYLTKPFAVDALLEAVESALASDELEDRRRAQRVALARLARLEKGEPIDLAADAQARPAPGRVRFSRLERERSGSAPTVASATTTLDLSRLSDKQMELLAAVRGSGTVSGAAIALGVSRSNVYASLRRIARKLEVADPADVVSMACRGELGA